MSSHATAPRSRIRIRHLVTALGAVAAIAATDAVGASGPEGAANGKQRALQLVESATRHEHAEGVARDYIKAHDLYCEAARLGSTDALLRMGWMYANGRGVERSDAIAHTLFSRAAKQGSAVAGRLAGVIRVAQGVTANPPTCLVQRSRPPAQRAGSVADLDAAHPLDFAAALGAAARQKLLQTVVSQAREHSVDPRLVLAVMAAESNFDPNARSPKNARGLMQLIPETAERFAVANILDPVQNVRGGVRYLRWLLSYFRGDVDLALAAYNAGEGAVNRFRGVPPYPETIAYIARIRARYPHDQHPFDPRIAEASPIVGTPLRATEVMHNAPATATRVTYFLDRKNPPRADSGR